VVIRITVTITHTDGAANPQPPQTLSCTTTAAGTCTITYTVPFSNVTRIEVAFQGSVPPAAGGPGGVQVIDP
jgi:hypothetical protein